MRSTVLMSPAAARLRLSPLLSDLRASDLEWLASNADIVRWSAGETALADHDRSEGLYLLISGKVRHLLVGDNGREVTTGVSHAGDFFGEAALFQCPGLRGAIVSVDQSAARLIRPEIFAKLVKRQPELSHALAREILGRLRAADAMIADLALRDVGTRLRRILVALAEREGESGPEGVLIVDRPTQKDLARRAGTCRETVSRTLSSLAKRGLVVARGRSLLVRHELLDAPSLA